ncbi:MAG: DUF2059 domain-containing protein [Planctomycetota bacterium]
MKTFILLLLAVTSYAVTDEERKVHISKCTEIVDLTMPGQAFTGLVESLKLVVYKKNPAFSVKQKVFVENMLNVATVKKEMAEYYYESLEPDDIDAILAFYKTNAGVKLSGIMAKNNMGLMSKATAVALGAELGAQSIK